MTDRARELVERLRARTVPVMGGAGLYEVVLNERADGLCNEAADFIEQSLTPPDTLSGKVVERVARAIVASFEKGSPDIAAGMRMDWQTWVPEARAAIAALQSRVSPQARMREALEAARRALSAVLGFPKGAALSENALDLCEQAFVGIDAALSTDPIPMSEDANDG